MAWEDLFWVTSCVWCEVEIWWPMTIRHFIPVVFIIILNFYFCDIVLSWFLNRTLTSLYSYIQNMSKPEFITLPARSTYSTMPHYRKANYFFPWLNLDSIGLVHQSFPGSKISHHSSSFWQCFQEGIKSSKMK
jgi:hypothetical protein